MDEYVTVTKDQKASLISLIRSLPAILSGNTADYKGIGEGFRTRIGFAIISLIKPNFEDLGRGQVGVDGDKWRPLSKEYLAYGRRFGVGEMAALKKSHNLGKGHNKAPGDKKGLLTSLQLKEWRRVYTQRLTWLMMRTSDQEAKSGAAAMAWAHVKKMGAKTKLEVFGNRQAQILVDTGRLRASLTPGTLNENGVEAHYEKPSASGGQNQVLETQEPYRIVVGTNDEKAKWHHNAKSKHHRRRLWPSTFPPDWWSQILGVGMSGLVQIGELFKGQ